MPKPTVEITAAERSLPEPVAVTVVPEDGIVLLRIRGRGIDAEYTLEEANALKDCLHEALMQAKNAHV